MSALVAVPPEPAVPEIGTTVVTITPAVAEIYLGMNNRNRHLNKHEVSRHADAMRRGEWVLSGESIKFSTSGRLIDGQHRLAAVVASGVSVPFLVVTGLPEDVQDVLDTGRRRTAGDQLTIHGISNANVVAVASRLVILYRRGRLAGVDTANGSGTGRNSLISPRQVVAFAEQAGDALQDAASRGRTLSRECDLRAGIGAACIYLLTEVDSDAAAEFFARLGDGIGLDKGSPILALRNRLSVIRRDRTRIGPAVYVSLVFRAWNAWREGRDLDRIVTLRNGEFIPIPEPH